MITRKYFYRVTYNGQGLVGIAIFKSWIPDQIKVINIAMEQCMEIWGCAIEDIDVIYFGRI